MGHIYSLFSGPDEFVIGTNFMKSLPKSDEEHVKQIIYSKISKSLLEKGFPTHTKVQLDLVHNFIVIKVHNIAEIV
jgi:hypothetical protein